MRFLPALTKPVATKTAAARAASAARYFPVPGLPYVSDWSVERSVRDGYEKVTWVYKSIDAIASAGAARTIVVRTGDPVKGKVDERSPLLPVLNGWSNEYEPSQQLRYAISAQLLLSEKGVFAEVVLNRRGTLAEMHLLPVDRTSPVPDDPDTARKENRRQRLVSHFAVQRLGEVGGVDLLPPFDPNDPQSNTVLWFKKRHPTDPFISATPMKAAGIAIDGAFYARLFNRNFMSNDGRPGGIVAVQGQLSTEDAGELKSRFGGGVHNAGRTTVLEADGISFIDTAIAPRDAQYVESMGLTKEEILLAFGVPESVIGNASGRTYDNADAEEEIFWRKTMIEHLRIIEGTLDLLTPGGRDDDQFVRHDLSDIHVLQRDDRAKEDRLAADFDRGAINLDEYLVGTGRDPLDLPASRIRWVTPGRVPVGSPEDVAAIAALSQVGQAPQADPAAEARAGAIQGAREADRIAENRRAAFRLVQGAKALAHKTNADFSDGIMLCLVPDDDALDELEEATGPDGTARDELHVTLAYLGKTDEYDDATREAIEAAVGLSSRELAPLSGEIAGTGHFRDNGDGEPAIALVDVPGLNAWREAAILAVAEAGGNVAENHGYTPHITLGYDLLIDSDPAGTPLTFDRLWLVWGEDWIPFELQGDYEGSIDEAVATRQEKAAERVYERDAIGRFGEGGFRPPSLDLAPGSGDADVSAPSAPKRPKENTKPGEPSTRWPGFHVATPEEHKASGAPAGWKDVVVADDPNARMIARGVDAAGRDQRRYSSQHTEGQSDVKFVRVKALHAEIPKLDKALKKDANTDDTAGALLLTRKLGLRPGSERDTGAKVQAYGATTLLGEHVTIEGKTATLDFTGKKGVHITLTTKDPQVVAMLAAHLEATGGQGQLFPNTNETKVNAYLDAKIDPEFNVKDLRTYLACEMALAEVAKMPAPTTPREAAAAKKAVATTVSKQLGNSPIMALKSYINPTIFDVWNVEAVAA